MAPEGEPSLLSIFKPPWRILRHESGNYRILDAADRTLCWIYVKGSRTMDQMLLEDEEAQILAKAIARLSRPQLTDCKEQAGSFRQRLKGPASREHRAPERATVSASSRAPR